MIISRREFEELRKKVEKQDEALRDAYDYIQMLKGEIDDLKNKEPEYMS